MKLFLCFKKNTAEDKIFWSSIKVAEAEDRCSKSGGDPVQKLSQLFTLPPGFTFDFAFSCVSSGSKIFLLGGIDAKSEPGNDAYMMDTSLSSTPQWQWKKLPSMKVQRSFPATAAVDGRVYAMGSSRMDPSQVAKPWGEFLDTNKTSNSDLWVWEPMPSPLKMLEDEANRYDGAAADDDDQLGYEDDAALYDTKFYAVMNEGSEKKMFLDLDLDYYRSDQGSLSFDVNANTWGFTHIPFCGCFNSVHHRAGNVILDGTLIMFCRVQLLAFDLRSKTAAHIPFPHKGCSYGAPTFLFHLGNRDICLVMRGSISGDGREILCQYFHLSPDGLTIQFGLLEKYLSQGGLIGCVLV